MDVIKDVVSVGVSRCPEKDEVMVTHRVSVSVLTSVGESL